MPVVLTDENFEEEVLHSDLPVLVDFWAQWCPPCKMMEPVIEELTDDYSGRLKIAKLNVDEAGLTASKYGIMSIPTFMLFNKSQELTRLSGALPKQNFIEWIDSNLKA